MKKTLVTLALFFVALCRAQVGIGTTNPDVSALLDITSTDKGVLLPRMVQAQRTAISSPATGLLVYQTDGASGWWYYNGTQWIRLAFQPQISTTYVGSVSVGDIGAGTSIAAFSGFVASATKTNSGLTSTVTVTHNLGLTGNQAIQVTYLSVGGNPNTDNNVLPAFVFNVTANSFQVFIEETTGVGQNIGLMLQLVNY